MRRILKRPVLRILPILLFFVIRSAALADMAWYPPPDPDSAGMSSRQTILIIIACIIGPLWLFAKGRMLKRYDGDGWRVVIPFCGRYLEYKYYWHEKYYWINMGVWIDILIVLAAVWGKCKEILMLAGLLIWAVITVLMRMKTMETFGYKKFLGLLELLGLGFLLDCLCAFAADRSKREGS